jgi:hypothetical protein
MSVSQKIFLVCLGAGGTLVTWGWISTPGVSSLSVSWAVLILCIYALISFWGAPLLERIQPPVVQLVFALGLACGFVFMAEILLEYGLLPRDNTLFGTVEFGLVFLGYFLAGLLAFLRTRRWYAALTVAVATSMLASLLWALAILLTFYVFRGTPAQKLVFMAEGNFDDFIRSGMHNFDTFVMEDFFGAIFFHLLLGPLAALILGALALIPGKIWVRLRP